MSIASRFVTHGKKIVAIGRNYADHIKELNNATPSEPFFFLKPTSSYLTDGAAVEIPRGVLVHHEVELGVVIGKTGRDIVQSEAMDHVAGYCLAIDYTARNVQEKAKKAGLPWSAAKGFDTFCPVGSFIPKDQVQNPQDLMLWLKINGETKQKGSTNLMLYRIPALIEHCSSIMRLEEGDLLLTGTPAGVGPIKVGDDVHCALEQDGKIISEIRHSVVAREKGYHFKP